MWISPTYAKEYRDWMARGDFATVHEYGRTDLRKAIPVQHPGVMALSLSAFSTAYYTRGIVELMDGRAAGWPLVQMSYIAAVYKLLFEAKAATLPAWSSGRSFSGASQTEAVLSLGLARLFGQTGDALRLSECLDDHFSWQETIGDRFAFGRKVLQSILEPDRPFSYEELQQDRKECCQKRDTWPTRPTEIRPFGVLDVEVMLRYPDRAAFRFEPDQSFTPFDDDQVVEAVVCFHNWCESPRSTS